MMIKRKINKRTSIMPKLAPIAKAFQYLGGKDTMAVFQTTVDTSPGILKPSDKNNSPENTNQFLICLSHFCLFRFIIL